jgi:uncharacterized membrane protein
LNLIRVMPAKGQDMQTSIFLAKLIGPFFLIVGVSLLINQAQFRAMVDEFMRSRALVFLTGLITLPAGLAIVLTHNVWVANWPVLITVLGWLTVFKGAIRLLAPQQTLNVGRTFLAKPNAIAISAAIWLVVGAVLTFYGYVR